MSLFQRFVGINTDYSAGISVEAVGYIGRILSHYSRDALGPYIMQTLLLLVAPALFAASIYMILGRLISLLEAEKYSVVRVKWLTKIFVGGDVLSFTLQSAGTQTLPQSPLKGPYFESQLTLLRWRDHGWWHP